jgi:hypothetical protein
LLTPLLSFRCLIRFRRDVYDIYGDLAVLSIQTWDVHWRNILEAPDTSERLVCPYHGRVHAWRIVDFDLAQKTNMAEEYVAAGPVDTLERMFRNLPLDLVFDYD